MSDSNSPLNLTVDENWMPLGYCPHRGERPIEPNAYERGEMEDHSSPKKEETKRVNEGGQTRMADRSAIGC